MRNPLTFIVTFLLSYQLTSVIQAQHLHVAGDILLNQGSDRTITLETNPNASGNNLTIRAGNGLQVNGKGGDLNLIGGNGDFILFGNGGMLFFARGLRTRVDMLIY